MKSWLDCFHQGDSGGPLVQKAGAKAAGDKWTQVGWKDSWIPYLEFVKKQYECIVNDCNISNDFFIPGRNCLLRIIFWMRNWPARRFHQVIFLLFSTFYDLLVTFVLSTSILLFCWIFFFFWPFWPAGPSTTSTGSSPRPECLEHVLTADVHFPRKDLKIKDLLYDPECPRTFLIS